MSTAYEFLSMLRHLHSHWAIAFLTPIRRFVHAKWRSEAGVSSPRNALG